MNSIWFTLMPLPDLSEDFREKHRRSRLISWAPLRAGPQTRGLQKLSRLRWLGVKERHADAYGLMPSPWLTPATQSRQTRRSGRSLRHV